MLENVLIVDGDVASRDTFYEILSSMGYRVNCVPNGKEAAIRVERERPVLVVIDAQIQNTDCFETMERIRNFDSEVAFVLLAKDELPEDIKGRAIQAGALAVIKKDFATHHMMKEILGILNDRPRDCVGESRQGHILVIEDEPDIRSLISNFLTSRGYSVAVAASGEEGLFLIKTRSPHLVLCDIRMPGMDGLMVLRKVREIDQSIKVIMLSAIQDEDVVREAIKGGASDYLTKPCSLMKLDALVLSLLA
jgi:CheY-like chemotaxis protein